MKHRIAIIDFWRIVGSLFIMIHHLVKFPSFCEVTITYNEYHWFDFYGYSGWIFVEFFFMLTGYFTCAHFSKNRLIEDDNDIIKNGLKYTIKKFKHFFPYTTIAITLTFLVASRCRTIISFIYDNSDYPLEVLLLGEAHKSHQTLGPTWFLSAMLLTFPIITLLCQLKNKYLTLLITGLYPLFYYQNVHLDNRIWPDDLFRAMAGMSVGIFIYLLNDLLKEKGLIKSNKKTLYISTIIEILCMLFVLFCVIFNYICFDRLILLAFAIALSIMTLRCSLTAKLNSKFICYLGELSMPIYIWHRLVLNIIKRMAANFPISFSVRITLYFICTFVAAVVSYSIIEKKKLFSIEKKTSKAN